MKTNSITHDATGRVTHDATRATCDESRTTKLNPEPPHPVLRSNPASTKGFVLASRVSPPHEVAAMRTVQFRVVSTCGPPHTRLPPQDCTGRTGKHSAHDLAVGVGHLQQGRRGSHLTIGRMHRRSKAPFLSSRTGADGDGNSNDVPQASSTIKCETKTSRVKR